MPKSSHEKTRKADELTMGKTTKKSISSHGRAAQTICFGLPLAENERGRRERARNPSKIAAARTIGACVFKSRHARKVSLFIGDISSRLSAAEGTGPITDGLACAKRCSTCCADLNREAEVVLVASEADAFERYP